jgi:hypothetical protein
MIRSSRGSSLGNVSERVSRNRSERRLALKWSAAVLAATNLLLVSTARGQIAGQITAGTSSTVERQLVCAEDLKPEIRLSHRVGCEKWDCCLLCPGPPDWSVGVGRDAGSVLLRFQDLSARARKLLKIEGNTKWDPDGRLRLGPGETTIRGFEPDGSGRWPTAFASVVPAPEQPGGGPAGARRRLEISSSAKPESQEKRSPETVRPDPILTIRYFRGPTLVGERRLVLVNTRCQPDHDASGATIAVFNHDSILVFAAGARGNASPIRVIAGNHAGIEDATGLGADAAGRLYALKGAEFIHHPPMSVAVFDAGANGNAAPMRTLRSSALVDRWAHALAVDDAGSVFVSLEASEFLHLPPAIMIFPPGAAGDVPPAQVLTLDLGDPSPMAVNRSGTKLFVAGRGPPISVYEKDSAGQFVRTSEITSSEQALWDSFAVAADGTLYALEGYRAQGKIFVFEPTPGGGYRQAGQILNIQDGSAIAVEGEFLYLGNNGWAYHRPPTIDIFSSRATGPSSPLWMIAGPNTQLWDPEAICIVRGSGAPSAEAR